MKKIILFLTISFLCKSMDQDEKIANYSIGALSGICSGAIVAAAIAAHKFVSYGILPTYNERTALIIGAGVGLIVPIVGTFAAANHQTITDDRTKKDLSIRTVLCGQTTQEGYKRALGCILAFTGVIGAWLIKQSFSNT